MLTRSFFALLLGLVFVCTPAQAGLLSLAPTPQTVNAGATLSVDLQISGLGDGTSPSVGVFDIDVFFDALLLSFDTAADLNALQPAAWLFWPFASRPAF